MTSSLSDRVAGDIFAFLFAETLMENSGRGTGDCRYSSYSSFNYYCGISKVQCGDPYFTLKWVSVAVQYMSVAMFYFVLIPL